VLDLWRQIACGNQSEIFAHRLELDGLNETQVVARLGEVRRRPGYDGPAWLSDAQSLIVELTTGRLGAVDTIAQTIPFGPLLSPIVGSAIDELARNPAWHSLLSDKARISATRQLWQSLGELFGLPLLEILSDWRASTNPGHADFAAFMAHMRGGGFAAMFACYPVLARVAGTVRRHWIASYNTFLTRLLADADMLAEAFGQERHFAIVDLRYGLSDPHGGGAAVLELCLGDGSSIFYKPRSLASDAVVQELLTLLSTADTDLDLRVARFIDRGTHGWTEGVQTSPCEDEASVRRYFKRAGAWLACFHLLNASDMHMENILACGEYPIPIDFETILQALSTPPSVLSAGSGANWLASQFLEESVLAVGMLPGYIRAEDGRTINVGGLEASRFEIKRLDWSHLNTAEMRVDLRRQSMVVDSNMPTLDGIKISVDRFRSEILVGLRSVLDTAVTHKGALRSQLLELRGRAALVRRVIRPTRFYYLLLRRLNDHRTMTDGVTWSLQTELIARLYNWDDMSTQPWKLFRQERADLCNMTIPAFYLEGDRTVATSWQGPVTNLHARDGISVAVERLDRLDTKAVDLQCRFAATALGATTELPVMHTTSSDDLIDGIVEHLRQRAIQDDSSAAWLGLEYLDHRMMSQIVPIGLDLYNGTLGIGLFLAAVSQTRDDSQALELAYRALAPIIGSISSENRHRLIRTMGCGGYLGVGSLVYGLTAIAAMLPRGDDALNCARIAAGLLTPDTIASDERFDLVSGSAGALLAVLKLHDATGDLTFLNQARALGDKLLDASPSVGGLWTSAVFEHQRLTGLSHGASGFALAFARLAQVTNDARYHAVVAECLAFERGNFQPDACNWKDTRPPSMRLGSRSPNQWCYGASGIGYARLALLDVAECSLIPGIEADLRQAVCSVLAIDEHSNDTLCCGLAGHADFLFAAGERLGDRTAVRRGRSIIAQIEDRWRKSGDVRWDQGDKDFNLGLMRGLAGVGYAALQAENRLLPRILILD
jgi:type 2 lantibiotic biosynthesis protein LanM